MHERREGPMRIGEVAKKVGFEHRCDSFFYENESRLLETPARSEEGFASILRITFPRWRSSVVCGRWDFR